MAAILESFNLSGLGKIRSSLARYKSRQCLPRDNVAERLHENCVTKIELTLINYAYIEKLINTYHRFPFFLLLRFLNTVAF